MEEVEREKHVIFKKRDKCRRKVTTLEFGKLKIEHLK